MITYKQGNLMQFTENAFGHGCNCQKRMASGVAAAVRQNYFEMVQADLDNDLTPEQRLGTYQGVRLSNGKVGFNIYSQFMYGRDRRHVDYDALETGVRAVCHELNQHGQRTLALPKIGCGLAGGDWLVVKEILEKISNETGIDITIYEFEPPKNT
jgi:O-acetyl-ADP-ribose deacetylase (regulator of RNase III)